MAFRLRSALWCLLITFPISSQEKSKISIPDANEQAKARLTGGEESGFQALSPFFVS